MDTALPIPAILCRSLTALLFSVFMLLQPILANSRGTTRTTIHAAAAGDLDKITWGTAASQPYPVSEAQGEVVNGKLYCFGGFDSQKKGFTPTSRAYVYDPAKDQWSALAPMPPLNGTQHGGVTHAGFATDGKDIYFAGGYTANAKGTGQIFGSREVWKYSVADNRYERLPDLPVAIAAGQLEYVNGVLHHISGTNAARTQDLEDHYALDLKNTGAGWQKKEPLPHPRQHAGSAVLGGKIYFIGGQTDHDADLTAQKLVHRYDPATDTWTRLADLPVPDGTRGRGHISSAVVVADNRLIVLGGETSHGHPSNLVSAYTPATDTWQNLTPLPEKRYSGVAAYLNGDLYYTGGSNSRTTFKGMVEEHATTAGGTPYLVVENQDRFPAPDHLAFSRVQTPWHRKGTPLNENHDHVKVMLSNKGTDALTITKLTLSDASAWKITQLDGEDYSAASLPLTLKAGAATSLTVAFIAKDQGDRVKILHGTLTIASNDADQPEKQVYLHGLWQKYGEDVNEPWVQEIIHALGFQTNTGYDHDDGGIDGEKLVPGSDEVAASYFVQVDKSLPVEVTQMSAYHGCCSDTESFRWYSKGSSNSTSLFTHDPLDGQSVLPHKKGSSTYLARGTFTPDKPFGIKVGSAYSDRTLNEDKKIGMRIWKAIDANGDIIPNAYIIGSDYLGNPFTNYDYQDNVYFISNVRPEAGTAHFSELTATPSALSFAEVAAGGSKKLEVSLQNQGKTYPDGSSDPAIQIRSITVSGPDKAEFSATAPASNTLALQASASLPVTFRPHSRGIKNAVLLVHYNTSDTPLRIPLYGIARDTDSTVVVVKRIKGAADAPMTISGKVWEADKNYRLGSIKLDKQVVTTPVAATDDDVLYQTYLSAAKDLAETSYKIPLPNGKYSLRMHFVENYWNAVADRIFSISIEDQVRLANFDIYKEVGYRTALVKDFDVRVTDGALSINFSPTVNRVAIAGLEIFADSASADVTAVEPEVKALVRQVQVFPNPGAAGHVQLALSHFGGHETVRLLLHDAAGRLVHAQTLKTDKDGYAQQTLKAMDLPPGLYLLNAQAPSGEAHTRLLIQ